MPAATSPSSQQQARSNLKELLQAYLKWRMAPYDLESGELPTTPGGMAGAIFSKALWQHGVPSKRFANFLDFLITDKLPDPGFYNNILKRYRI